MICETRRIVIKIYSNAVGLPPTAIDNPNAIYYRDRYALVTIYNLLNIDSAVHIILTWVVSNFKCVYGSNRRSAPGGRRQLVVTSQVCVSTQLYSYIPGMDDFCQTSCLKYPPSCPKDRCKCL